MFRLIRSKIANSLLHALIKLGGGFQRDIERYLDWIHASLGFECVTRLLLAGNLDINHKILRHYGAAIGSNSRINSPLMIQNAARDYANLVVGNHCHIGSGVLLDLTNKIEIEDNVTISMRSSIITHFDVGDSCLKHHGFIRKDGNVKLESDVYLGCGATILHGVVIGRGALIGACSLVTSDILPGSVAVGVPAKVIRKVHDRHQTET